MNIPINNTTAIRVSEEDYKKHMLLSEVQTHPDEDDLDKWYYRSHQPAYMSGANIKYVIHKTENIRMFPNIKMYYERFGGKN